MCTTWLQTIYLTKDGTLRSRFAPERRRYEASSSGVEVAHVRTKAEEIRQATRIVKPDARMAQEQVSYMSSAKFQELIYHIIEPLSAAERPSFSPVPNDNYHNQQNEASDVLPSSFSSGDIIYVTCAPMSVDWNILRCRQNAPQYL